MKATIKRLRRVERSCPHCHGLMELHCTKCSPRGRGFIAQVVYPEDDPLAPKNRFAEEAEAARQRFQEFLNA